ncbi:MAG: hypothetical protein HUU02_13195, partial [Bacteroidetes bacterium]|nr:hypothetical protein [Bacteroidota bacterium]
MRPFLLLVCILLGISTASGDDRVIVVAQNGSGDHTTISAALRSVPQHNTQRTIIRVRNGIYREKLYLTTGNIVIVGESRDSTVIEYAELRKNWLKENPSDRGSATVNIDSGAADITFANLTIRNPYGFLYGDHDHQFAIWGRGTRIILLYCSVIGGGGDTVSLWNSADGMYYHAECYFEGWVDYVCPRGWCYITDSRFYGHNLTASLWHHGGEDKDQKFVIRNSYFDGVEGFPLGRHHVDGQFYLLDCIFSRAMADEPIHYPSYSPNARPWKWGTRHYYDGCRREGGDYAWFADNLHTAVELVRHDIPVMKKGVLLKANVHKCRFEAILQVANLAFEDTAHEAFVAGALDVEFLEATVLE